jgi:hypothetical protein
MKEEGFENQLSSGRQYEEICGKLLHNGDAIAMISQQQGIDKAPIEIYPPIFHRTESPFPSLLFTILDFPLLR